MSALLAHSKAFFALAEAFGEQSTLAADVGDGASARICAHLALAHEKAASDAALTRINSNTSSAWRPIESAPKDGTWILLRGRNGADHPMIPVVCSWRGGDGGYAWRDSASLKDMTRLVVDVPLGSSADYMPLPAQGTGE